MTKLTLSRARFEQIRVPMSEQSTISQHGSKQIALVLESPGQLLRGDAGQNKRYLSVLVKMGAITGGRGAYGCVQKMQPTC
jgi:hypothetical protein